MEYFNILFNMIILYIKRFLKKGIWKISIWQNIHPSVKITTLPRSNIELRKNIVMERYGLIFVGENAKLSIGERVYFNQGCVLSCKEKIKIGSHCLFGPNVKIYDNNHKFKRDVGVLFEHKTSPIQIGNNCWIASNVTILKGTKIGNNCVIGANCVVSGVIPDNSVVKQKDNLIIEEIKI